MIGTRSDNNGPPVQTDAFRLGDVLVTPTRNTLEANGIEVRLQPKVMEVLCYLAYHHKRVVPNEELTREVWRGRVVTHGSVQKSITQLRKAFAAFPGEQEVVTHYARRGYHLQIEPHYLPPDQTSGGPEQGDRQHIRRPALMLLPVIALLLAVVYLYQTRHKWVLTRDHRTAFTQLNAVTVAPGFARSVAPHPDNRHLAYIVDTDTPDDRSGEVSHVVIRYSGVRDWWVAGSAGSWQETAWSPDGRQLAVLELTQEEAAPATQDYVAAEVQLYDIHVFEVDLDNHRVLGKHRLSQWQGHISSLTWWDSATLELVGRQGKALIRQRYRYELGTQRLETVESPDHATNNPLLTRVHNGMTALARVRDDATRIEFLRPDQTRFASYVLDYRVDDISWLPDGSGILASAADQGAPSLLYRDGKRRTLSFDFDGSVKHLHPKYSADGSRIYLTQATPRSELWLHTSSGARQVLQNRHLWRVDAMLSPTGTSLAYVSMADDLPQIRIMALPDGPDYPLQAGVAGEPVHNMIWADTDTLVFKAGRSLYRYSLPNQRSALLWSQARDMQPLALLRTSQTLLVLRLKGDAVNLWRLDAGTGEERQLTFGSLGAAVAYDGDVYFQYAGQDGLWVWRASTGKPENLHRPLPRNSRILSMDESGIYYVGGQRCRESTIYHLELANGSRKAYLPGPGNNWHTTSFLPQSGAVVSPCGLQRSSLMVME